jgi:hypothetical protein
MAFAYNDEIKNLLITMSLIDALPEGCTVGYGGGLAYSGSATGSVQGAFALWDSDIEFTGTASLSITIPTSSYLNPESTTSSSLASIVTDYTNFPISGGFVSTQMIVGSSAPTALLCSTTCYQGESVWFFGGQGPFSPTVQNPGTRQRLRPLKGGISITSTSHSTPFAANGSVGTMGLVCQDSASGALVGLTNNHVVIRDAFYTSERTFTNPQNEFDLLDGNGSNTPPSSYTELVYQSGEFSAQPVTGTDNIGRVVRYVPVYKSTTTFNDPTKVNRVDGALFSLYCTGSDSSQIINFTSSFQQYGLSYTGSMPFASTAEINNLLNNNYELYSSGRTTGVKGSPDTLCPIRIFEFTTTQVGYSLQGTQTAALFTDLIKFVKPFNSSSYAPPAPGGVAQVCPYPAWAGDSGSTLIANIGGVWKIVGLVFAGDGAPYGVQGAYEIASTYGLACRIDHVASQLGIKAWTGSIAPVVDPNSISYITISGSNDTKTLNCSGSTYWQVGLTEKHNIC